MHVSRRLFGMGWLKTKKWLSRSDGKVEVEDSDHCDGHPAFDVRFGGGRVTLQDKMSLVMARANDAPVP